MTAAVDPESARAPPDAHEDPHLSSDPQTDESDHELETNANGGASPQYLEHKEKQEQQKAVVNQELELVEPLTSLTADADLLDDIPADVHELDLTHLKIESLKTLGLDRVQNVKVAGFRQNLLTSMHGLEDLPQGLEQLDLYDNRLDRMDKRLEHFGPEMKSLDLSFNNFRKIRHLQGLTGLEDLYLCQNDLSRIQGLDTLVNITNLELGANKIRKIECLDKLVNLEKLWLARNKITKLEGLEKLTKLKLLSIQNNRLTKIEGLDTLTELEELYVSFNGIEEIEGLDNNLKLTTLDVGNNRLTKLSNLKHLQHLEELWASYNQIEDLSSVEEQLKHLPNFSTIYLEHNPVQRKNMTTYNTKVRLALGPSLVQIDANPVRQS